MTGPHAGSLTEEHLAEIRRRWALTTQGPWFWWGNTDNGDEALCGRQPGLGVCEVLSTITVKRTAQDPSAESYREYLHDVTDLTEDEVEERVRDEWLTDQWGEPTEDQKIALTDENHIRRALPEVAVYQVARAQGMPDDTPRTDPRIYRADICDVRNPNGRALAASWADVHALLDEVDRLRSALDAGVAQVEIEQ